MNTEYIRKHLKQAMKLIESIDLTENFESYNMKRHKQKSLNEAYSIMFDINELLKMEEKDQ